jgi:hypothetical protein
MSLHKYNEIEDMQLRTNSVRQPEGDKVGGLNKKHKPLKKADKGLKGEAKFTQDKDPDVFTQPPLNSIPKGNKKSSGTNPPKQPKSARNRMSGKGGRIGASNSLGRL